MTYSPPTEHTADELAFDRHALAAVELVRSFPPLNSWSSNNSHEGLLAAMLLRAGDTLESIVTLRQLGNEADAVALARVLFEHVAMYVWLMGDDTPPRRTDQWMKRDNQHDRVWIKEVSELVPEGELKAALLANPIFSDDLEFLSAPPAPNLQVICREADSRWFDDVCRVGEATAYVKLEYCYTLLYRPLSGFVHAYGSFIYSHVNKTPQGKTALQSPGRILDVRYYYRALAIFIYGLAVNFLVWGWPAESAIRQVQPRYNESDLRGSR